MNFSVLFLSLFCLASFAGKKEHRHHEAHVHGAATLQIAFENQKGVVRFQAAADGVLGFEHSPKTSKEKQLLDKAISKFENEISKIIQLPSDLGCIFQKEKIGLPEAKKSEHIDFIANFQVQCQKHIQGSEIQFSFASFPGLHDIDVTILVDDLQKSVEVKNKVVKIQLTKD